MLEEDKLLRFHEKLREFLERHLNFFLSLVAIFFVLIFIGFGYNFYKNQKEEKTLKTFFSLLHQDGSEKNLISFAEKNLSTSAGKLALLYLWMQGLEQGDFKILEKIAPQLEKALNRKGKIYVNYVKGKLAEVNGDYPSATKYYEALVDEDSPFKQLAQVDLVRVLTAKGDKARAVEMGRNFLKEFGNSTLSGYMSYKLQELSGL